VLVIGDFDADGATSTALMVRAMRAWGFAAVDFLVPNRFEFGYGLTPEIVALAKTRAPTLIVTVDNGISSVAGVAAARAARIDVLITDHHLPGAALPDANVIVNPNLIGSRFGSPALAGVGVAFYVMAGLKRGSMRRSLPPARPALPSSSTSWRLARWRTWCRSTSTIGCWSRRVCRGSAPGRCVAGIRALLKVAGRGQADLTSTDLAFAVAPRLNAAGRIDDMKIGIECLLADDEASAMELAAPR
jgi:single-stranded-DNA-specific exonuclease